jgi:hypothetical protein
MDWQRRINRPNAPAVPILNRRMHRVFWVPPRYRRIVAAGIGGRPFTLRAMARDTGYSLPGLWHALRSLSEMGIAHTKSTRGAHGRSIMFVNGACSDANVSPILSRCIQLVRRGAADYDPEERRSTTASMGETLRTLMGPGLASRPASA